MAEYRRGTVGPSGSAEQRARVRSLVRHTRKLAPAARYILVHLAEGRNVITLARKIGKRLVAVALAVSGAFGPLLGLSPSGQRKAVGGEIRDRSFSGVPCHPLGWAEAGDAGAAYLPHLVRDWYARAVFDHYLKGDGEARGWLKSPDPFGDLASVRREIG